ncbi:MAG: phage/plasmid primase, P4 family [Nanoarchaeota archaeon]|mgnify:FL=1
MKGVRKIIPKILQKEEFRFVKIRTKEKAPFELDWTMDRNYKYNDKEIINHIEMGGNYGIVCGYGGLVVIDCDTFILKELVDKYLNPTLIIKTGSGKYHYYFTAKNTQKRVLNFGKLHYGEIQGKGSQVVAPGSIHPCGNRYEIDVHVPISELNEDDLKRLLNKIAELNIKETEEFKRNYPRIKEFIKGETEGNRNTSAFTYSINLRNAGIGYETALQTVTAWNERNKPPLLGVEVERTVQSAYSKEEIILNLEDINEIRNKIIQLIAEGGRKSEVTEILVNALKEREIFYTIRDDINPEIWIYKEGIYIPHGGSYIEEFCREVLKNFARTDICKEVIWKIQVDTYVNPDEFFIEPPLHFIPLKNGVYNLNENKLESFHPSFFFFRKLPVEYENSEIECPKIKKFFKEIFEKEEDINLMQELFGYFLFRNYFIKKAFMFTGVGDNGKSVVMNLIKTLLGVDNCSNISLQDMEDDQYSISNCFNKLANICGDLPRTSLKNTGFFKQLTGGDVLQANRKFKTRIQFVNYAKLVFSANELPFSYDSTDGFWIRWIIWEFPYQFKDKKEIDINNPKNKLKNPNILIDLTTPEEIKGLFNWAVLGLNRLRINKEFSYSSTVEDIKKMWIRKTNSLESFLEEEIVESYEDKIPKNEFKGHYLAYCKKYKSRPFNDQNIRKYMMKRGLYDERQGQFNVPIWVGIKFKGGNIYL